MNGNQTDQLIAYVGSKDAVPLYLADCVHPVRDALLKELGQDNLGKIATDLFAGMRKDETLEATWFGVALARVFRTAEQGYLSMEDEGLLAMSRHFAQYVGEQHGRYVVGQVVVRAVSKVLEGRRSYSDFLERENKAGCTGSALKGYTFGL